MTTTAKPAERLDDPGIQRFLGTKEVVVLATLQPDGAPLAMPMWFLPDGETLVMVSVAGLRKVANLQRDPRVSVVAETGTRGAQIKNVIVQGRAEILPDGPERRALAERLLQRYHPDLERLWGARSMPTDRVMFRIRPSRVRSRGV